MAHNDFSDLTSAEAKLIVRGVVSYLEEEGLPVNKSSIFRHFHLSRSQGYAALNLPSSKRNDPAWEETRGRPLKIPEEDMKKMEGVLWDEKYEDMVLNWTSLAAEAGVSMAFNTRTLQRALGTLGYRKCLGCGRGVVHKRQRERRVEWARKMMELYPQPQDWRQVRFSGEIHFGFSLDGKMRVLPRSGEKNCFACEEMEERKWLRDVRRVHCWAAIGYGFKSELYFYEGSTSANNPGLMSMPTYISEILAKPVAGWLEAERAPALPPPPQVPTDPSLDPSLHSVSLPTLPPNPNNLSITATAGLANPAPSNPSSAPPLPSSFILEENSDTFAHGALSKTNDARDWKKQNNLRHHYNCGDSPDLSALDSLWPPMKSWQLDPAPEWKDEALREACKAAWEGLSQERADFWAETMGERVKAVVQSDGRMIPW